MKTASATASGIAARPITFCHPKARASPGANSAASTVPELPAPAIPSAFPWCSGGYQEEASKEGRQVPCLEEALAHRLLHPEHLCRGALGPGRGAVAPPDKIGSVSAPI